MKAIMVMYDSLNRRLLPNYGCSLLHMPNFCRLAEHVVTFERAYVGSMPCIPARREIHTGRYNFLHRSWGPLEPFDDSMPELLKKHGVHSHIVTDHLHYVEDGGVHYLNRYSTWETFRGQEGDECRGDLRPAEITQIPRMKDVPERYRKYHVMREIMAKQDIINRRFIHGEEDFPQTKTFSAGLDFIRRNCDYDNWFLQIETFDPHEPYFSPDHYQDLYSAHGKEYPYDWPAYGEDTDKIDTEEMRKKYFALASMCDANLGKILDIMDEKDLWKDTMLIVNTDHGFLLGEHGWWGKNLMPLYNDIANIPFFIWDPRSGCRRERRQSLVQTIDIAPTLLEYFGIDIPSDMQGKPLKDTVASDKPVRDYALYGYHGGAVNITDGTYTYLRYPESAGLEHVYEYTLMPSHMHRPFSPEELRHAELSKPFSFTKGCPVLKIPTLSSFCGESDFHYGNLLFNVAEDPEQLHPLTDSVKEAQLLQEMKKLMIESDAPAEVFEKIGIQN